MLGFRYLLWFLVHCFLKRYIYEGTIKWCMVEHNHKDILVTTPDSFKLPKKLYNSYDVITIGSGTLDVFVDTDSEILKKKGSADELMAYPLGSKLLIKKLNFEIGGGGTNTAVSFARFGLKTGWIGSIGKCDNSKNILEILHKEKIDFLGRIGNGVLGYSVILDSIGHDRTILTFKGENNNLDFNDISSNKLKTKWFYFCSMVGKSFITQKKLAKFAYDNKIRLAFNPSSYQAKLGAKVLAPILKYTNLLILNLEEARLLVGQDLEVQELIEKIHKTGPHLVIITDGSKGAYCSDMANIFKVHPHNIKIKETTGAGDAFASSFLGAFIKSDDNVKLALKIALINAQSVIQHYGAKNILLSWNDVVSKEKSKPVKITKL